MGDDKYEAAMARAFVLAADNKDAEALAAFKEAQTAKQTDFVKAEIERLTHKMGRTDAAKKAADGIKQVLDAGQPEKASQLATDALSQFGDSDMAETITNLKRQADALIGASLEGKQRGQRFLNEAEEARKTNNLRGAVLAYEQALANGADAGELKNNLRRPSTSSLRNMTKTARKRPTCEKMRTRSTTRSPPSRKRKRTGTRRRSGRKSPTRRTPWSIAKNASPSPTSKKSMTLASHGLGT